MADQSTQSILPFSTNLILQSSIASMHYGSCYVFPWKAEVGFFPNVMRLNGQLMWSPMPTPVKFNQKARMSHAKDLL